METPELNRLYMAIQNFRDAMEGEVILNEYEQLNLENYIALLQMTYMEWKRRNVSKLYSDKRAA